MKTENEIPYEVILYYEAYKSFLIEAKDINEANDKAEEVFMKDVPKGFTEIVGWYTKEI